MTVYFYCKSCKKQSVNERFKDDLCQACRVLKLDRKNNQKITLINKKWKA